MRYCRRCAAYAKAIEAIQVASGRVYINRAIKQLEADLREISLRPETAYERSKRWREKNIDLYRDYQREYKRKRRAKLKENASTNTSE